MRKTLVQDLVSVSGRYLLRSSYVLGFRGFHLPLETNRVEFGYAFRRQRIARRIGGFNGLYGFAYRQHPIRERRIFVLFDLIMTVDGLKPLPSSCNLPRFYILYDAERNTCSCAYISSCPVPAPPSTGAKPPILVNHRGQNSTVPIPWLLVLHP